MALNVETDAKVAEHHEVVVPGIENLEDGLKPTIGINNDVRIRQKKSKEEKRLILRMDALILPLLSGSIFFAYLVSERGHRIINFRIVLIDWHQDRGQIGNARIMGMQKDIGISDHQYFNCLMIFCTSFPTPRSFWPPLLTYHS